ncbi:MAG TPA: acyl carrier protein [Solirubrobacterales bacterium]|nr:acyl carrier protein [Solirubrobacterales bacterium]
MNSAAGLTAPVALEDVATLVRAALKGRWDPSRELAAGTMIEDLGLSSLQLADVLFQLEERKGVRFDGGEVSELRTLGELVELANDSRLSPE